MSSASSAKKASVDLAKIYYSNLQREFVGDLLKNNGDFLLRRGADGGQVLSVNNRGEMLHFKFGKPGERLKLDGRTFDTLEALIAFHYESGTKFGRTETELLSPIANTLTLIDYARLHFDQVLGKGNFGEVWRATLHPETDKSVYGGPEEVAIKILAQNTSAKERAECMAEARLTSTLDHENVVKLKGLCFWMDEKEKSAPKLLIVLEYCNLGSLDKLLEKDIVGKKGKERALLEAATGIEYLHQRSIIHRDIASRNCLVQKMDDKFKVKIGDFGLSRLAPTHYALVTKRRLPIFSTPPDTLKARDWTIASDVWSFGVLMQEVYNGGKNPYEKHYGSTPLKQIVTELNEGFRVPPPADMPSDLAQLSLRCLSKPPERLKMSEVVQELKNLRENAS